MLQLQRIDSQLASLSEKLPFNNTLKLYKAMSNVYCRQKKFSLHLNIYILAGLKVGIIHTLRKI